MIRYCSTVLFLILLCSCAGIRVAPQQSKAEHTSKAQLPRWILVNNYQLGGNYRFSLSSSIPDTLSVYAVDATDASLTYHGGSTDLRLGWGVDAFLSNGWLFYSPQAAAVPFDTSTGTVQDVVKQNFEVRDALHDASLMVARSVEDKNNKPTVFFTVGMRMDP